MGWMARVAIRVFGVGGADTMDRIDKILFFTIMKFYIHYKKELTHKIMSQSFFILQC